MNENNEIILNLDKLHTTDLGVERIRKNLHLKEEDVVDWCRKEILKPNTDIIRKGKNWYISVADSVITVNAYSYTIITAHKLKK